MPFPIIIAAFGAINGRTFLLPKSTPERLKPDCTADTETPNLLGKSAIRLAKLSLEIFCRATGTIKDPYEKDFAPSKVATLKGLKAAESTTPFFCKCAIAAGIL